MNCFIHNDINDRKGRHSHESGNPGKDWIPGQARNDKLERTYIVMYKLKRDPFMLKASKKRRKNR